MKIKFKHKKNKYSFNLNEGIRISTVFAPDDCQVKAFDAPDISIEAVRNGDWVGSTQEGGILNFKNLMINPHGNGTHTECVGHIAKEPFYIKDCLKKSHFVAQLVTIDPEKIEDDSVLTFKQIAKLKIEKGIKCLIVRTLPNLERDKLKDWTETNPTYISHEAMQVLVDKKILHFMIDVPSVDREHDEGKLLAHKTFWNYPSAEPRINASITEMIYVPNEVKDGIYLVDIQTLPLAMDASPSNIIIYKQRD